VTIFQRIILDEIEVCLAIRHELASLEQGQWARTLERPHTSEDNAELGIATRAAMPDQPSTTTLGKCTQAGVKVHKAFLSPESSFEGAASDSLSSSSDPLSLRESSSSETSSLSDSEASPPIDEGSEALPLLASLLLFASPLPSLSLPLLELSECASSWLLSDCICSLSSFVLEFGGLDSTLGGLLKGNRWSFPLRRACPSEDPLALLNDPVFLRFTSCSCELGAFLFMRAIVLI
jgi:hypothetical protein